MKQKCYIIRDLFPSYMNHHTSDQTKEDIEVHLKECVECHGIYETMKKQSESNGYQGVFKTWIVGYSKKAERNDLYKHALGLVMILVMIFRFLGRETNGITTVELLTYVPLTGLILMIILKNAFNKERTFGHRLYVCHIAIFVVSMISLIIMQQVMSLNWIDTQFFMGIPLGETFAMTLLNTLRSSMIISVCISLYGLYASIKSSNIYFSIVCHGLGSITAIMLLMNIFTSLDLSFGISYVFYELYIIYAEGVILSVFVGLYLMKSSAAPHLIRKDSLRV